MKNYARFLVLIINLVIINDSNQQNSQTTSPCPNVFQYQHDGSSYYGIITTPSPSLDKREVILQLSLSLRGSTTQSNVGVITLYGSTEEATNNIINRQPIKYHVRFPYGFTTPKVVQIIYDNTLLCSGTSEIPDGITPISRIELRHVMSTYTANINPSQQQQHQQQHHQQPTNVYQPVNNDIYSNQQNNYPTSVSATPSYFSNLFETGHYQTNPYFVGQSQQHRPQHSPASNIPQPQRPGNPFISSATPPTQVSQIPQQQFPQQQYPQQTVPVVNREQNPSLVANDICGTRYSQSEVTGFVFGGTETRRGEWPWVAAIYLNKATGLSFNCGGTLINTKTVITAAHCINTSSKNYQPHEVLLWLGRYSLVDWNEEGAVSSNVERIVIHPDYKRYSYESYDADIAILTMQRIVTFNQYVRPICLWNSGSNIQEVEGHKGTVVGWGKDGTDRIVSNIPKKVDLPIVNSITCVQTSESLYKAVSNRTFCAGTLNGEGPCHGDSGGGLMIYRNNRWLLRGIVSAGLSDANSGACKLMDYVVFTDVSLFTTWIRTYV